LQCRGIVEWTPPDDVHVAPPFWPHILHLVPELHLFLERPVHAAHPARLDAVHIALEQHQAALGVPRRRARHDNISPALPFVCLAHLAQVDCGSRMEHPRHARRVCLPAERSAMSVRGVFA